MMWGKTLFLCLLLLFPLCESAGGVRVLRQLFNSAKLRGDANMAAPSHLRDPASHVQGGGEENRADRVRPSGGDSRNGGETSDAARRSRSVSLQVGPSGDLT